MFECVLEYTFLIKKNQKSKNPKQTEDKKQKKLKKKG